MFIDTMDSGELLKEHKLDIPELVADVDKYIDSDKANAVIRKNKKKEQLVLSKKYTTKRGNKYLTVITFDQKIDSVNGKKSWDWASYHIGFMKTHKGTLALFFYPDCGVAISYTPHFFHRYKERMLKVCDWKLRNKLNASESIESIATIYNVRNRSIGIVHPSSVYGTRMHILAPTSDGATLMQWDINRKILQANTFLTENMLSDKQWEFLDKAIDDDYYKLTDKQAKDLG